MVKEGLLAEAAQLYARAQALEPQNVSHAYNHAVALDRLGQYANALAQYDAAARLADRPGSPIGADGIRQRASALRQALVGVVNK
jgi:Flp pilus assembly protein TadD